MLICSYQGFVGGFQSVAMQMLRFKVKDQSKNINK